MIDDNFFVSNRLHWTCLRTLQHAIGQVCFDPASHSSSVVLAKVPDIRFRGGRYEVGTVCTDSRRTRSDIAHAVGVISRFMHNPGRSHWNAIKHVFRYLAGTKDHGILFGPNPTSSVVGYTDLCGQLKINNRILLQIWQWNNLMEVETSRVHDHLNDRSRICSRV